MVLKYEFNIVRNPSAFKKEGAFPMKNAIMDKDYNWYCQDYRIYRPSEAIRILNTDSTLTDAEAWKAVLRIVGRLNKKLRQVNGASSEIVQKSYWNGVQTVKYTLEELAEQAERLEVVNGYLIVQCIKVQKRIVRSQRIDWHVDFITEQAKINRLLDVVYKYDLEPEPPTPEVFKTKIVPHSNGTIQVVKVPAVSDKDAKKVAGCPDGRGIKEFMPSSHAWGGTSHKPTTYAIPVKKDGGETYYSLEEGHSKKYKRRMYGFKIAVKGANSKREYKRPHTPQKINGYMDIYQNNRITVRTEEDRLSPTEKHRRQQERLEKSLANIRAKKGCI